jgi:OmpA family
MPRRTPPVAHQVVPPFVRSTARFSARLIDFDTGSATLEKQHENWIREKIAMAKQNSSYGVQLIAYASKSGSSSSNQQLSHERANAVHMFMVKLHPAAEDRIELFLAKGEEGEGYNASANDNDAAWRAVEVHIFIGSLPPKPTKWIPIPKKTRPLPGGRRFVKWAVAAPGGVQIGAAITGGINNFLIRNIDLDETRQYVQPIAAVGVSLGIPNLDSVGKILNAVVTGASNSAVDFTTVQSKVPVTWADIEACLVRVTSAGAALGQGVSHSIVTFEAAGVWQRSAEGNPVNVSGGVLFQLSGTGLSRQTGLGMSTGLGPLFRVPG